MLFYTALFLFLKKGTDIAFSPSNYESDIKKDGDRGDKQELWWDPENSVHQTSLLKSKLEHDIFTIVDVKSKRSLA